MIGPEQVLTDFKRMLALPVGPTVTVGFNGETCTALKSTFRKSTSISPMGETYGDVFTLRIAADALTTLPTEKDVITVDGVEWQVAETSYSGFESIYKMLIFDEDA